MADKRLDASCGRIKRFKFWLVFIDAKHMKSEWASCLTNVLHGTYFSRFRKFIGHIRHCFTQGVWSAHAATAISTIQGCFALLVQPNDNRLHF